MTVSSICLSPSGTDLLFVRSEVNAERSDTHSRIQRIPSLGGDPVSFTNGENDTLPKYAASGDSVAFLRGKGKDRQIWTIPTSGGEASQLTNASGGVSGYSWSPDSARIAYVFRAEPNGAQSAESDPPQASVVNRIRYRDDGEGWRGDTFTHLFVANVKTRDTSQLTDGEGDDWHPERSPDGERIAFLSDRLKDRDIRRNSEVRVIPSAGGKEDTWSNGLVRVGAIKWSPDGTRLAVIGSHDADIWDARQSFLYVIQPEMPFVQLTDGTFTTVMPPPEFKWANDNRILFIGDSAGESFICTVPATGGDLETVSGGNAVYTGATFDNSGNWSVVISTHTSSPGDLERIELGNDSKTQLTSFNLGFLDQHQPSRVEKFSFTRAGMEIQSRVHFPFDFSESDTYPLVLDIHGGPNGRFSEAFDFTHQVLAGAGYVVLAVNPRGSSSYGPEFMKAVLRDWGGEDFQDLMSAVDRMCERPYIDPSRLGVHGYSYGEFMSSWIVGHDHRFKAAVIGAPCTNLHSMYGTSDIGVSFGENQWGGSSIEDVHLLHERSPLTYARNVQTPVLLLHGETDYRCPIEQSEQFYVALKRQGKDVEFVRFPNSSHGFRGSGHPALTEEYFVRMIDWLNRYTTDTGPSQN